MLLYHPSNDHMTDNLGFGRERRQALNQDVLHNRTTFRDSFREMLASVSETTSFEDCQRILKKSALISSLAMAPLGIRSGR
jgi:2-hydroxy-3-keto-5-methylthiopentenyl-1-phosphate phosphatase